MYKKLIYIALLICTFLWHCSSDQKKQENSSNDLHQFIESNYTKQEFRIPMRDGKKLFTTVYSPKDTSVSYPVLIKRTPYGLYYGKDVYPKKLGPSEFFTKEKFIFVYQDVRGRFMSEGTFVNMRPYIPEKENDTIIDESTDAYDTIEWLLQNLNNHNGKVGIWGISYPGFYASMACIDAHDALKAVSPQAPIADWYFDDFHHHGAFFLVHFFNFFQYFGQERDSLVKQWPEPLFNFKNKDYYSFFLNDIATLNAINRKFYHHKVAFWDSVIQHPDYDEFWQKRNILPNLKNIKPAVMTVAGLFDAEDLYGSFKTYHTIEKNNKETENILVAGPWRHGGWARTDGARLGDVFFGDSPFPSLFYREFIELPFFVHHLKNGKEHKLPEAYIFDTGINQWKAFDRWPPENTTTKKLYLSENGKLSFDVPENSSPAFDEFVSNPHEPVPYTQNHTNRMNAEYMTENQAFAAKRADVLTYQTGKLEKNICVAGNIPVRLIVSTSQGDADWIVKLIDVYPDDFQNKEQHKKDMRGYQQMLRSEVFRGRYRHSYQRPEPFEPNKPDTISFDLIDILHTFKSGHQIMIQVQSTWFPLVDRNPQKYVRNIYTDTQKDDFSQAVHRLYRKKGMESYIEITLME